MKILLTSVGRRVELVEAFKNASMNSGIKLEIHGGDIVDSAPALFFCDKKVMLPRIDESDYISFLIDYCRKNNIDSLIPTIDTDLLLLSKNKEKFGNTEVIISDYEKIKICRDKRQTCKYLKDLGFSSPKTYDDYSEYNGDYPCFIKPIDGSSSINAYTANSKDELENFSKIVPNYIIQEYINGVEYTVDVLCDFESKPLLITPRIRLATRSGEVSKTQIRQDEKIINEVLKLVEDFKPIGQITIQLIRQDNTNKDYFIEINPRFGGGAPLSIKAGADSCEYILRLLNGEKLGYKPTAAIDNAVYSRFDQSIRIK